MRGFDIIGDIHGCADQLEELLGILGYAIDEQTGAYGHSERQAIFVGDLIDRGPQQMRVLEVVRQMVDSGSAQIVMGNHEFNAVAYATEHPVGSGEFLRRHSDKNNAQHREFLDQVTGHTREYYLGWFKTLPLWLDLGRLRVVHACWHEPSIRMLQQECGSDRLSSIDQWIRASTKGDPIYEAVEVLLKGPEISLVAYGQPPFMDQDRHLRARARVRWWNDEAMTLRELAELSPNFMTDDGRPYPRLPDLAVDPAERSYAYAGDVPVFYGHYWRQGAPKHLQDWTKQTACVDFSAVKGGRLVAYRWSGETAVDPANFVSHDATPSS